MIRRFAACAVFSVSLWAIPVAAHEGVSAEIAALDVKIQQNPKDAALLVQRAALLRREGQFVRALADLAQASDVEPNRRDIVLEKGLTLAAKGDAKEAEIALSAYLASGPPLAGALEARGKMREGAKRFVEARADYAAAIVLRSDPELFLARGRMDEALGHWDDAARGYEEGLKALSGAVVLRMALVRVEAKRGKFDRAIALVDEMLATLPLKADWLLLRADLHMQAGRVDAARKDRVVALQELDERMARRPTDLARITRAKALLALGRKKEAAADLEIVLARTPQLEEARTLLTKIQAGK